MKLGTVMLVVVALILPTRSPAFSQVTAVAPVPTAFRTAKSAFVSNAGYDRAYIAFYQALSAWNKYQLALDPRDVDISFEVSYGVDDSTVTNGSSNAYPYLTLVSRDVKTNIILWSVTEPMGGHTGDKDFAATAAKLVEDLKALSSGEIPSQINTSKKKKR